MRRLVQGDFCLGGRGGVVERGDRVVARAQDREDLVQAGDLERLGDVLVDVDDHQRAVARAQALDRADQHAERGGVEERRLGEVDDDPALAGLDRVGELLLELGGGEEVDLAAHRHHVAIVVESVFVEGELWGHRAGIVAGPAGGARLALFVERRGALPQTLAVVEEVPRLDHVALRILDVDRAVAAGVLDGPAGRVPGLAEAVDEGVEAVGPGREREVHVAPALVAELLLAGRPQAEARVVAGGQPDAVVLALEDLEPEGPGVEGLEALERADLEGQLREPGDRAQPAKESRTRRLSRPSDEGSTSTSSAMRSSTLPTPGSDASASSALAPPERRSSTCSSIASGAAESRTATKPSAAWVCECAAIASATSRASSRRSTGHWARAASMPTTRDSTGATSGPLTTRTRASLLTPP